MPNYLDESSAKQRYLYAAGSAYLASLSIGLVLGYSSPVTNELKEQYEDLDVSLFGSILTIGALIGGFSASVLNERLGRKGTIIATAVLFAAGWQMILLRQNSLMLYGARFFLGLACGIDCMVVPVYLGEVSLPERRGIIGTGHQFGMVFGVLIAYCLGALLRASPLALACFVPAVANSVFMFFMPESPTWLVKSGKPNAELMDSLYFLFGRTMYAEAQREILTEPKGPEETYSGIANLTSAVKPLGLALSLMFFQQLSGINAVIFYVKVIFDSANTPIDSNVESIIIGSIMTVFTVPAALVIDRAGRRLLLHISGIVEVIGLTLLITFYVIKHHDQELAHKIAFLPVTALSLYVAGFSIGYGPVPWLMMSELLPVRARSVGTGICTAFNWFCAFLVTKFFPDIMHQIGEEVAYAIFLGICTLAVVYVFLCIPETKGKTLEEIEAMFQSTPSQESAETVDSNNDSVQIR